MAGIQWGANLSNEKFIRLQMDPVPKGRPRFTRTGHAFTDKKTLKAEAEIRKAALAEWGKRPFEGAVELIIQFTFKKPKSNKKPMHTQRPDLDNCAKLVSDAINGVAFLDDCQVVSIACTKGWGERGEIALAVVEVEP